MKELSPNIMGSSYSPLSSYRFIDEPFLKQGSTPQRDKIEMIANAIACLPTGEQVSIDTQGDLHSDKTPFITKQVDPLATIRRVSSIEFELFSGIPPLNATYGISIENPVPASTPLSYSMTLKSGDFIQLANTRISIPTKLLSSVHDPVTALEQKLAHAKVGDLVILGRTGNQPSMKISRLHATVRILKKDLDSAGNLSLLVTVFPGLTSDQPLSVKRPYGDEQLVFGKCRIHSGTRINLGTLGSFCLPYPSAFSAGENANINNYPDSSKPLSPLATFLGQDDRLEFSQRAVSCERLASVMDSEQKKTRDLEDVIHRGLKHISENDFSRALDVMNNSSVLERLGYTYSEGRSFLLSEISEQAIQENLNLVAINSWFNIERKTIAPSFGLIRENLKPTNEQEEKLLKQWRKEVALIFAEEFTHALQDRLGKNVSRKAALFPSRCYEGDVAVFFHEQGVSLSYEFVVNRYSERKTCLELVVGYQSEQDQIRFSTLLSEVPVGTVLAITPSSPDTVTPNQKYFSPSWPDREDQISALENKKLAALRNGEECSANISRNYDGSFTLAPSSTQSRIFAPDSSGYYSQVIKPTVLEPGTPFYVGKSFKFVL